MADPVLKFPSDQKPPGEPALSGTKKDWRQRLRDNRRTLLLVVVPLIALASGLIFYVIGGRYVTTDDAYVGAQKVLITPDISGKIGKVLVKEGQRVAANDELFEIDPVPFQLALQQAQASLDQIRTNYENLRSNLKIYDQMGDLAQQGIDLKQRDVERKQVLIHTSAGSQLNLDTSITALVTAQAQLQLIKQQSANALNQLLGKPDLPLEQFPPYLQAQATVREAQRNLDHTLLRAPISGVATQVDSIQLGRFIPAGTPVFSIIDDTKPWVDANLKESDFTHIAVRQPVTVTVDAFPDHAFKASIGSLSPGTGAQFAILPPQNATGNFVKVVQRVPVRIYFDQNDTMIGKLKAGMSSYVSIDTGHRRSLGNLFGFANASSEDKNQ